MTAEASLYIEDEDQQPGYLVPLQAILPVHDAKQGHAFVYGPQDIYGQKNAGPCSWLTSMDQAIVHEGLTAGDIIAVAGVSFLADGLKVRLMKQ